MKTHFHEAMQAILKKYHSRFADDIPYETLEDITQNIILKMLMKEEGYFKNYHHVKGWGCKVFFRDCFKFLKRQRDIVYYDRYEIHWQEQCAFVNPDVIEGVTSREKSTMDLFYELCEYIRQHAGRNEEYPYLLMAVAYEDRRTSEKELCLERDISSTEFRNYIIMGRKRLRKLMWEFYAVRNFNRFRKFPKSC